MLVGDAPVVIEAHDDDIRQNDLAAGRRNTRQIAPQLPVVSEADDEFVDHPVLADRAR